MPEKKISGNLHISSDILVGFPGESDNAFNNTLDIMRESGLGRVHVFPYSERQGTIASRMPGKISHNEKISRTSQAIALGRELYDNYAKNFVGHELEILIEQNNTGHTRHYIDASCTGHSNEIIKAEALRYVNSKLECERRD